MYLGFIWVMGMKICGYLGMVLDMGMVIFGYLGLGFGKYIKRLLGYICPCLFIIFNYELILNLKR